VSEVEAWFEMGRVLEAHSTRAFLRSRLIGLTTEKDKAERDERWGGGFEDCGDFYREMLAVAKAALSQCVSAKISQEKRYKALKLTFLERFPYMREELETRLAAQIAALAKPAEVAALGP
jgi:2,4-dienoyl-CoA reductase-like NADH-dependent reductase (Old Yellow Enzyme family)